MNLSILLLLQYCVLACDIVFSPTMFWFLPSLPKCSEAVPVLLNYDDVQPGHYDPIYAQDEIKQHNIALRGVQHVQDDRPGRVEACCHGDKDTGHL